MMADKTFYDHFRDSMRAAGIPDEAIPSSGFASATSATAAIVTWAEAAKLIGARATLGELIAVLTAGSGVGGVGAAGVGVVAIGTVKAVAGILAAYWIGCVIGACLYAIQMTVFGDSWLDRLSSANAMQMFDAARLFNIKMPGAAANVYYAAQCSKEHAARLA